MSEIVSCALCESPMNASQCSNADCMRAEFTTEQSAEYRRYLSDPAGTARALVEARAEIERKAAIEAQYIAETDAHIEQLSEHVEKVETKLAAYETQIASLQVDRTEAKIMIRQLTARSEELIAKSEETNEALVAMTAERDEAVRERDENLLLSGDITCFDTDNPGCGRCNRCYEYQRDFMRESLDMAKEELKAVRNGRDLAVSALETTISERDALKIDLAAMMKKRDEARAIAKEQQRSGLEVLASLLDAEKARDTALAEIERMRGEDYHRVRDALIETLRKERDEARTSLIEARKLADEYRQERDAARVLLNKAQRERAEARTERDAALADLRQARAELDENHDIQCDLLKQANDMRDERDAAVERAEAAEAQLAKVRRDRDTMISVHDEVEAERDRLRDENERLREDRDCIAIERDTQAYLTEERQSALGRAADALRVANNALELIAGGSKDCNPDGLAIIARVALDELKKADATATQAADELRRLRDENARLKAQHEQWKREDLAWRNEQANLLGRAVVALHRRFGRLIDVRPHELPCGCTDCETFDVLADATAAQAAAAWRAQQEERNRYVPTDKRPASECLCECHHSGTPFIHLFEACCSSPVES